MTLSVVIPVHNAAGTIGGCLAALTASNRRPDEILVVDTGSSDDSVAIAREHGVRVVLAPGGQLRPKSARSFGWNHSTGDVVVFVDPDVAVQPDALARIEARLNAEPDLDAVTGTSDTTAANGWLSLYVDLRDQHNASEGLEVSAVLEQACLAVRRSALNADSRTDGESSIEATDAEFAESLACAGRPIQACDDVRFVRLSRSTFLNPAVPWSRADSGNDASAGIRNRQIEGRISAIAVWFLLISAVASVLSPWVLLCTGESFLVLVACNRDLLLRFARTRRPVFLCAGIGLHLVYLLVSGVAFAVTFGWQRLNVLRTASLIRPVSAGTDGAR